VTIRPLRLWGDPGLRTPCKAVTAFDERLAALVTDLEETVIVPGRAGVAANQIGVGRRVFAYNIQGRVGHVVNPVIESLDGEQEEGEGCLSLPGLWFPTCRAAFARVSGFDRHGEPILIEGEGLMARCLQHEVDHLDGRLFIDRLERATRKSALRELRIASAVLGEEDRVRPMSLSTDPSVGPKLRQ
jgi:peptide deformylase